MAVRWLPSLLLCLQLTAVRAEPVVPLPDPGPGCLPTTAPPVESPFAQPELQAHISSNVQYRIRSSKHLHELELNLDNLTRQEQEVVLPQWLTFISAKKNRVRLTREFRTTLRPGERRVYALVTEMVDYGTDWLARNQEYSLASVMVPKPDPSEPPPPPPAPPKVPMPPEMQLPNPAWKKIGAVVDRPATGGRWYALSNGNIPLDSIVSIRRQGLKVNGGRVVGSFRNRILLEVWSSSQIQAGDEVLIEAVAVPPYKPSGLPAEPSRPEGE